MHEARRIRPAINRDNAFFFEALEQGTLCVQGCDSCHELRHPPVPMCPSCHDLAWSPREMQGEGELISFVVMHYPVLPPFEPGYIVAVVEFDEGPRLVTNLEDIAAEDVEIGMRVKVTPQRVDADLVLTVARPTSSPSIPSGAAL